MFSFESYFLPKLAEEHREMMENKDPDFCKTFLFKHPENDRTERELRQSDSVFVQVSCELNSYSIDN